MEENLSVYSSGMYAYDSKTANEMFYIKVNPDLLKEFQDYLTWDFFNEEKPAGRLKDYLEKSVFVLFVWNNKIQDLRVLDAAPNTNIDVPLAYCKDNFEKLEPKVFQVISNFVKERPFKQEPIQLPNGKEICMKEGESLTVKFGDALQTKITITPLATEKFQVIESLRIRESETKYGKPEQHCYIWPASMVSKALNRYSERENFKLTHQGARKNLAKKQMEELA